MTGPLDLGQQIFERRFGRQVGAMATVAGIAGAGLLGLARFQGWAGYSFGVVTGALLGALALGPITDRIARRIARGRMQKALTAESDTDDSTPVELRARLRVQALAKSLDGGGLVWPLAKSALLAVVAWLPIFGLAMGSVDVTVGKALSYLVTNGGFAMALFALAAVMQGRSILKNKRKAGAIVTAMVMTAMVLPALRADDPLLTLAVSAFYLGTAGLFVMVPTTWWMRRRFKRERHTLSQLVLPSPASDTSEDRDLLMATINWKDGPGALRAEALRELATRLGDEVMAHLDSALASDVEDLRKAAMEIARDIQHRAPIDLLLSLEEKLSPAEAKLLPVLLHRHPDPRVEPALLRLLAHGDLSVVEAAAESLGLVGSVDTVPALKAAAKGRPAAACKEAIRRIRIRFTCAPGQLSVVSEAEAGALSDLPESAALSLPRS